MLPVYDFHTHTFLSDGVLSPMELIRRAHDKGYAAIAITDHVDLIREYSASTGEQSNVLVEDTSGQGHLSKAVDGALRHCIFVPIE